VTPTLSRKMPSVTVNRWFHHRMLCSSAASNETGILDGKFARSLGMVAIDCQARSDMAPPSLRLLQHLVVVR
jgi:hypothetical protein